MLFWVAFKVASQKLLVFGDYFNVTKSKCAWTCGGLFFFQWHTSSYRFVYQQLADSTKIAEVHQKHNGATKMTYNG